MTFEKCPTTQDLSDFSCGRTPDEQVDVFAAHLDECPQCQRELQQMDVSADGLTAAIATASSATDEFSADEIYQRLGTISPWPTQRLSIGNSLPVAAPPKHIAGCEIQSMLGRGGMGVVYQAIHKGLGRQVAVKLLSRERLDDDRTAERFQREMTALGRVDHANVVKAFDAGEEDGTAYLVMELIEGLNVSQIQRRSDEISVSNACEIVCQAAMGLEHAHEKGLVHRDVKPSNLMVNSEGTAKVLDLGLAMLADMRTVPGRDISSRMVMGTVEYMAPEQMTGTHDVDGRADVYSLGVTLFELLTGQTPWQSGDGQTLLQQIRAMALMDAPPLQSLRSGVPEDVADLLQRMLTRNVASRNITADEVVTALTPHCGTADLGGLIGELIRPQDAGIEVTTFSEKPHAKTPFKMWPLAAVSCCVVLAILAAAFLSRSDVNAFEDIQLTPPLAILTGPDSNVMDLELFADDRRCAVVSWDGAVTIRDLDSDETLRIPPRAVNAAGKMDTHLNALAISPDEQSLAIAGSVHRVHLVDANNGHLLHELFFDGPSVRDVHFTSDGQRIVALTDQHVVVYSVDGEKISQHSFDAPVDARSSLRLLPGDQTFLMTTSAGVVERSLDTGETLRTLDEVDSASRLAVSEDGSLAATVSSRERRVVVWDIATGEELHRFGLQPEATAFRAVQFFNNDRLVISGNDKTIRTWNIATELEIGRIQAATFCTQRFDITSDGKRIVSAGGWHVTDKLSVDGEYGIRIWQTE